MRRGAGAMAEARAGGRRRRRKEEWESKTESGSKMLDRLLKEGKMRDSVKKKETGTTEDVKA